MKKIKIVAQIDEDDISFSVQKSKDTNLIDILGLLNVITNEVRQALENKFKIVNNG